MVCFINIEHFPVLVIGECLVCRKEGRLGILMLTSQNARYSVSPRRAEGLKNTDASTRQRSAVHCLAHTRVGGTSGTWWGDWTWG